MSFRPLPPKIVGYAGDDCQTGVYAIQCFASGRLYIGSTTVSFAARLSIHICDLNKGKHHCHHLQRAWNKYGCRNFTFVIIGRHRPEDCLFWEQFWINSFEDWQEGILYNECKRAHSCLGRKHTKEAKQKISERSKGRFISTEQRAAISKKLKGRKISSVVRSRMGKHALGEKNCNAVLTTSLVREIRRRAMNGDSYRQIGRDLGFLDATVRYAAIGETWGHIK